MLGASMSHSRSQGQQTLPLLHRRNALLLLYALLYALDGVGGLDVNLNLLARQCLDLDHHPSPGAKLTCFISVTHTCALFLPARTLRT